MKPLLWSLSWLVPKRPGLVVFTQTRGRYADNARALFEWLADNSTYQLVWLYSGARAPEAAQRLQQRCPRVTLVARESVAAVAFVLRAKAAVVSHRLNEYQSLRYALGRAAIVVVWHAIMVKRAHLTDESFTERRKKRYLRRESRHFDAVIASSEIDRYHTAAYMGVRADRVYVTGLPRQDAVNRALAGRKTKTRGEPVRVLYAPTHRDTPEAQSRSLFFPFPEWEMGEFAEFCREHQVQILLRPHPYDRISGDHASNLEAFDPRVFVRATMEEFPDTRDLLPQVDAVITDYSSVYLDLLPFDIPCIFIPFDIAQYTARRGLAYPYDLITPGPKVSSGPELSAALIKVVDGAEDWASQRRMVKELFFGYSDERSCERVSEVLEKLMTQ